MFGLLFCSDRRTYCNFVARLIKHGYLTCSISLYLIALERKMFYRKLEITLLRNLTTNAPTAVAMQMGLII